MKVAELIKEALSALEASEKREAAFRAFLSEDEREAFDKHCEEGDLLTLHILHALDGRECSQAHAYQVAKTIERLIYEKKKWTAMRDLFDGEQKRERKECLH